MFKHACAVAVSLTAVLTATAAELSHRWSFSGNYTDSVTGANASTIGSAVAFNEGNTAVVLSGNGNSAGSLNLGVNQLPTDVPDVTLEIWATQTAIKKWARIFDYGPSNTDYLTFGWNRETAADRDLVELRKAGTTLIQTDATVCPFTLNTPYHISVRISARDDGSSVLLWARRHVETGAVENRGEIVVPNWQLANFSSPKFYLGHSQFTGDLDANAIYDEVRVWKGLLTDEQLTASVLAGPDTLPDVSDASVKTVRWTGAVDDNAATAGNWDPSAPDAQSYVLISGACAMQAPAGTSFTCAGVIFDNAVLSKDCDWSGFPLIVKSGTLDVAGRKLTVSSLSGSGLITDVGDTGDDPDRTPGELHLDIPSGVSVINDGVRLAGGLCVFKKGAGSFTARARMSNTGAGKMIDGTFDLVDNRWIVDGLDGAGTVKTTANLLINGDMQADTVTAGAHAPKSPYGWSASGNVYVIKNDKNYANSQANGSNWCFINSGSSIYQSFYVPRKMACRVRLNVATRNNSGTQWRSNGNVSIDGKTVISWSNQNNLTATRTGWVTLEEGYHKITVACTSNSGAPFDNVTVAGAVGVLEVRVPENTESVNNNVVLSGANLLLHKTGKGRLVMNRDNKGYGLSESSYDPANPCPPCTLITEGVLKKSTTVRNGSCGAQYGTIEVRDGGQMDLSGRTYWDYLYLLSGDGPDGSGALINTTKVDRPYATNANEGFLRFVTLTGDTTIGGTQPWALLFWDYGSTPVTLNGYTLTMTGTTIYSGGHYFSGTGRLVIGEGACYEVVQREISATDCDVLVNGTFSVHDKTLTPIKSLSFGPTGAFSNPWETDPPGVVKELYAPPLTVSGKAPRVQLGTADSLVTALDLSLFTEAYDGRTLTFYPKSILTVRLGARLLTESVTKLVSWTERPDLADCVVAGENIDGIELGLTDDGLYAYKLEADMPATAWWTGAGAADNLSDPANWVCANRYGDVLADKAPANFTTVIIDNETTFSIPEGAALPFKNVRFGEDNKPVMTQWGRIYYAAERDAVSGTAWYMNTPLGKYTPMGKGDLTNLNNKGTAWGNMWLDVSQLRFDGWFKVSGEQAGTWTIKQYFDDYWAFAVDGDWKLVNPTYLEGASATMDITEGWHRFTIICGDTWGGQGANGPAEFKISNTVVPMTVSINGAAAIPFSSLETGSGRTVIKLEADCDWRPLGIISLKNAAMVDLNGHTLHVSGFSCDGYLGAGVTNSAAVTGTLVLDVAEGQTYELAAIGLHGNLALRKTGAGTLIMSTPAQTFRGGMVIEEGVVKPTLVGTHNPVSSFNLLKNGNFDESFFTANSGSWSYANVAPFSCPGWTMLNSARSGLSQANGTWVKSGQGVGKFALYLQTNKCTSGARQDMTVEQAGTYYYFFHYAGRPKYTGAVVDLRLIHNGVSRTLASVTASNDTGSICEGYVDIDEPGVYTLEFFQHETSDDRASWIDFVIFTCCQAQSRVGAVTVKEGAVFDMNGQYDFVFNSFVLDGGTLQNSGAAIGNGTSQLKYLFLTADSTLALQNSYGFIGSSYSRTGLDLGGHTLTVNLVSGNFYLYNTDVKNGVLDVKIGGWLETGKNGVVATNNVTLVSHAALRINGAIDVGNYTATRDTSTDNDGTALFTVRGAFRPETDVFYGCQLADGATLDLSARKKPLSTTAGVTGGSKTVSFTDGATIYVDFTSPRADLKELLAASENAHVVRWTAETAPAASVKFKPTAALRSRGYSVKKTADGVKLVPGAFILHIR
jgi:autotransporter-associated beta strand protein